VERTFGHLSSLFVEFSKECLTSGAAGLAWKYHLRSNSGSNGPIAKDCHRFLVAGPFKLPLTILRTLVRSLNVEGEALGMSAGILDTNLPIADRICPVQDIRYASPHFRGAHKFAVDSDLTRRALVG
jgi:hypothetical protein